MLRWVWNVLCSEKERMLVQLLSPLFTEINLKNLETFRATFFYSHLYEELVVRIFLTKATCKVWTDYHAVSFFPIVSIFESNCAHQELRFVSGTDILVEALKKCSFFVLSQFQDRRCCRWSNLGDLLKLRSGT